MLKCEPQRRYIVYPNWAEGQIPCAWKDLPRLLANPQRSRFFDDNARVFLWNNPGAYPQPIQPFHCLGGPHGGGIIEVQANPHPERWLPEIALGYMACYCCPAAMVYPRGARPEVSYLEPKEDLGEELLCRLAGDEWHGPELHLCATTVEHAASAGCGVFVVVAYRPSKQPLSGLAEWSTTFGAYRLTLDPAEPATGLREEVDAWFVRDPGLVRIWFALEGCADRLSYTFAVTLYAALHLAQVAGKRLFGVHLVGDIDGRPNYIRHFWR